MTMHFNEFDAPAALEDGKPRDPTGCPSITLRESPVHKRIDAVCTEPGCPNAAVPLPQDRIRPEDCRLADDSSTSLRTARPVWKRPADIYQTQPKDRCVM